MSNDLTIGLLSPGEMGAAIGGVLTRTGLRVLTCLAGRSELTRLRAAEAGLGDTASYDELVGSVDVLLSVLVPAEARAVGEQVAASIERTGARPTYVDCNAIAPQTVRVIGDRIVAAGARFIDAGIIGGPPRDPGDTRVRLYCSGPETGPFEALAEYGLNVRVVGPEIGQASSLKMVYAASTKGTTALWTELFLASRRLGVQEQLLAELGSDPVANRHLGSITGMPRRARRWAGEMDEIAATLEGVGLTPRILQGAADLYRLVGESRLADQTEREPDPTLDKVIDELADFGR